MKLLASTWHQRRLWLLDGSGAPSTERGVWSTTAWWWSRSKEEEEVEAEKKRGGCVVEMGVQGITYVITTHFTF